MAPTDDRPPDASGPDATTAASESSKIVAKGGRRSADEPDTAAEPSEAGAGDEPEADGDAEVGSAPEAHAEPDTEPEPDTEAEPDDADVGSAPEAGSEPEPDTEPERNDAEVGSAPEAHAAPEAEDDDAEIEPDEPADGRESDGPGAGGEEDPADTARRRFLAALAPRLSRPQLVAAVICAVLGFSIVVQADQKQVASLSSLRQSDLLAVLDNVTQESERLDDQVSSLRQTVDQLRSTTDDAPAARRAAQARLTTLGILAGTVPATGPGIELDIADPQAAVNATDILETVQELRDAGAEAMQLGSVRVVAQTAFLDVAKGVQVDRTVVTPPYRLLAIGDPATLGAALQIPGGVLEVLHSAGAQGTVRDEQVVDVTALVQLRTPQYARPVASPDS